MRNPNPFTDRQIRLLEAIREKLCQISDPDPEILTHESYEFYTEHTKQFGKIPKIRFKPAIRIKTELIKKAGLADETREKEISQVRRKYGIRKAPNSLARLFEAEWNNIMLKAKKAAFTVGYLNQLFATRSQIIAEPTQILQRIITDEYSSKIKIEREPIYPAETGKPAEKQESRCIKPYDEELAELEQT